MELNKKTNPQATPDQIEEYKRLKARNEWIKMNENYLNQIQRKQLFFHKTILFLVFINLIVSLLSYLL